MTTNLQDNGFGDTLTITTSTVATVAGDLTTSGNASTALAAIDTELEEVAAFYAEA